MTKNKFNELLITLVQWKYLPNFLLMLIVIIGAGLRIYHLGYRPLWYDESITYWDSQIPIGQWIGDDFKRFSGPPLFLLLLGWVSNLGHEEIFLRSIACLAGILAIPAMYWLARKHISTAGSLIAALILCLSPAHLEYSQHVREYTLTVLFAILILVGFSYFLERGTWKITGFVSLAMIAGIFTHYGLGLLIISLNLVMIVLLTIKIVDARKDLMKWGVGQIAVLIAVFLLYQVSLKHHFEATGYGSTGYLAAGYWNGGSISSAISFAYARTRSLIDLAFPGYILSILIYLGFIVAVLDQRDIKGLFLIGIPFIVTLGTALLGIYPYGGSRHNLFLTPLLYLLTAIGMDYLWRFEKKKIVFALLTILLIRKAIQVVPDYYVARKETELGIVVQHLQELIQPEDPIYVCLGNDYTARYYLEVRYPMDKNPIINGVRGPGPRDYIDQVDNMLAEYGRAWMLMFNGCGDMTPLLDHIDKEWEVELVESRYPDGELYYVD